METHSTNQTAYGLARVGNFIRAAQWRAGEELGLTPTQMGILSIIRRRGPSRVQLLADQLGIRQATASDAISSLATKKLAERKPDPADSRATLIVLTPAGRRAADAADVVPPPLQAALESLAPEESALLQRSISRIVGALQKSGAIDAQRMCVTCRYFQPNAHPGAPSPHHCGFVDAAFGDAELRIDCGEHAEADEVQRNGNWSRFLETRSA